MTNTAAANQLDEFLGTPAPSPYWRFGKWVLAGILLLLLVLLVSRWMGGDQVVEYVTGDVRRGDIAVKVTATGNLAPTRQVDVGSEISGIVERVMVDVNDRVVKGQPIAVIDTSRLDDAVARSSATLAANAATVERERATLAEAQAQLARLREVRRLSGGQVPSETELASQTAAVARAVASLRAAQANVAAARAQLSSDSTQVAKAVIRAPVSGVVLKRTIDPGQTVQASFNTPSLFIIAEDLTRMKLEVAVDEANVGQVKAGQEASFTVDAYPGRTFPAMIERVNLGSTNLAGGSSSGAAASTSNVVSFVAALSLANEDLLLRPGMTATATIVTSGEKNVLMVPNAALRFTPPQETQAEAQGGGFKIGPPQEGGTDVKQERGIGVGSKLPLYVLDANNKLRAISVTTGWSDGRFTAVASEALRVGQKVVIGQKAKAGQ